MQQNKNVAQHTKQTCTKCAKIQIIFNLIIGSNIKYVQKFKIQTNTIIIGLSKHLQISSSFSVPIIVNHLLYININTTSVVTSNKSGRCVPHNCNITSCTTSCTRSVPEIVRHKLLVIVLAFHATTFSRIWSKLHTSQTATVHSSPLKVIVLEQENLTDVCLVWIASSDDVCVSYQK